VSKLHFESVFLRVTCWFPCVSVLFFILLSQGVNASQSIHTVDLSNLKAQQRIVLNGQVQYLVDEQGLNLESVMQANDDQWQANTERRSNFGISANPYWFRLALSNVDQAGSPFFLRVDYPHTDKLDVYIVNDGILIHSYQLGDTVPYAYRPVDNRIYLLPLDELALANIELYIRAESQGPMELPIDVLTHAEFYHQDKLELIWYGAYFGTMLVMFFYNLFIYILVRDVTYFYYLFYVASTMALQFTLTGASFQYVYPESTNLNNTLVLMLTALMPFSAVSFVRSFLKLESTGMRRDRIITRSFLGAFAILFVSSLFAPYMIVLKATHALSFLAVSAGFYFGLSGWRRGVKAARTFAMAWLVYLVFIVVFLLNTKGIVQPSVISEHALEIGSALELILLSLSFGHRINEEKEMRIQAQEEALHAQSSLNKNLDLLVQQRTEELEEANRQLKDLSIRDGLTGVFNRRHFDELFQIEYQRSFREKNWLCVVMLDIDHFKGLNDTYGHQFGDVCLKTIADVALNELRRPPDLLARYGGEEFVVLLPNTDLEGGRTVAEKIRHAIESITLDNDGQAVTLTASMGVACVIPSDRDGFAGLLKLADQSLYQAKESGRNCVVCSVS